MCGHSVSPKLCPVSSHHRPGPSQALTGLLILLWKAPAGVSMAHARRLKGFTKAEEPQ